MPETFTPLDVTMKVVDYQKFVREQGWKSRSCKKDGKPYISTRSKIQLTDRRFFIELPSVDFVDAKADKIRMRNARAVLKKGLGKHYVEIYNWEVESHGQLAYMEGFFASED